MNTNLISISEKLEVERYKVYWQNQSGHREIAGIAYYTPNAKFGEYKLKLDNRPGENFYLKAKGTKDQKTNFDLCCVRTYGMDKSPKGFKIASGISNTIPIVEIQVTSLGLPNDLVVVLSTNQPKEAA